MTDEAEATIDTLLRLDPLADLPRTGWVLRGVADPESIADHSFGVAVVAMMLTDALRAQGETVDGERVLRMALLHDSPEAATGDVPLPGKTPALSAALADLEADLADELLPASLREYWREAAAALPCLTSWSVAFATRCSTPKSSGGDAPSPPSAGPSPSEPPTPPALPRLTS
jgi:5'-deoxynucleotidase YfbR-like HD superfamily hydrolase